MRSAGMWLLIAALAWASLLNGAAELWVLVPASIAAAVSAILVCWSAPASVPRFEASVLFVCVVAMTVYTAFQAVPLPASVVQHLSPHAADVWARALHALERGGPRWHPLTLDPNATRIQTVRGSMYASTFLTAWSLSREPETRRRLEQALILLPVAVAFGTAIHLGLDARKLWGFYAPRTGVGMIAPFFNKNQLSGFINIGLVVALASTVSRHPVMPRSASAAIVLGLSGTVVFLGSRGAVISAVLATGVVLVLSWRTERRSRTTRYRDIALPILIAVAGIGLVVLGRYETSAQALHRTDVSKLALARTCFTDVFKAYPLFGMGRGSFESGFPEFRHDMGWFVYTHPENLFAQWLSEWGLPAMCAVAACAFALRPQIAMARSRAAVGPFAALVALFLQNLVDFSSEFPAVVACLTVCAAIVVGGTASRQRRARVKARLTLWAAYPRHCAALCFAATLVTATVACADAGHDLLSDRQRLREHPDGRDDESDLTSVILRHPAEPYFAYVGAVRASRYAPARVPAWVGRTLERAPVYGPAHVVLARWLRARSPAQARLEYRVAQQQGGEDIAVGELLPLVRNDYDALEIAPPGHPGIAVLDGIAKALQPRYPASVARVDAEILRRDPNDLDALTRRAQAAWFDLVDGAPWCPACEADGMMVAAQLEQAFPRKCAGYLLRAKILAIEGKGKSALGDLANAAERADDRSHCVDQLARLALAAHDDDMATRAIQQLAAAPCAGQSDCADNLLTAAKLELLRHSPNTALVYLRRAAHSSPDREDVLAALADVAAGLGLNSEALDVYRNLSARYPANAAYREGADRASAAAALSSPHSGGTQ